MKHILIPSPDVERGLAEMALYGVIGPVRLQFSTLYRHNTIIITRFKN
jgi:hypothetical protein